MHFYLDLAAKNRWSCDHMDVVKLVDQTEILMNLPGQLNCTIWATSPSLTDTGCNQRGTKSLPHIWPTDVL